MRLNFSFLAIALWMVAGCGGNDANQSPATAAGTIYGQSWTYAGGEARPSPSHAGMFTVYLFDATDHKPCEFFPGTERGVDFDVSAQVGDYDVGPSQSSWLTFTQVSLNQAQGSSADSGSAHISAVSADSIQGTVTAHGVSGSINTAFNAKFCNRR